VIVLDLFNHEIVSRMATDIVTDVLTMELLRKRPTH